MKIFFVRLKVGSVHYQRRRRSPERSLIGRCATTIFDPGDGSSPAPSTIRSQRGSRAISAIGANAYLIQRHSPPGKEPPDLRGSREVCSIGGGGTTPYVNGVVGWLDDLL